MSIPALWIRLSLEETKPTIVWSTADEGERARLTAWIDRRTDLGKLLVHAAALADLEEDA